MKTEMIVNTLKHVLQEESGVLFAYLFGSYADGKSSVYSDVDVAVFMKEDGFEKELTLHHKLEKALKRPVDLLILNRAHNVYLLDEIIRHGIVVKEHPDREDFELRKWQEILDFKSFQKSYDVA